MNQELSEALEIIEQSLPETHKELLYGLKNCNYDQELISDIAKAISSWKSKQRYIKDPYVVHFFDGKSWSKITEEMYQQDAYRKWYSLTKGGKQNNDSRSKTYYFLGSADLKLEGRHQEEVEEEDSIRYLLNKSFGDV